LLVTLTGLLPALKGGAPVSLAFKAHFKVRPTVGGLCAFLGLLCQLAQE